QVNGDGVAAAVVAQDVAAGAAVDRPVQGPGRDEERVVAAAADQVLDVRERALHAVVQVAAVRRVHPVRQAGVRPLQCVVPGPAVDGGRPGPRGQVERVVAGPAGQAGPLHVAEDELDPAAVEQAVRQGVVRVAGGDDGVGPAAAGERDVRAGLGPAGDGERGRPGAAGERDLLDRVVLEDGG